MKALTRQVKQIVLTEIPRLDPITVTLNDFGAGQGSVTIVCFGKAWTAFWGGMGPLTVDKFILSCDEFYVAKNLSNIDSTVVDYEAIREAIAEDVDVTTVMLYEDKMTEAYGADWCMDLPTRPNPEYQYLLRIVRAVQEGLML